VSLEHRIKTLEDRAAIADRVVAYFLAADGDDLDGVGASFTVDASFSSSGKQDAAGRVAIVDFIRNARTHMGLTVHTPHYVHITALSDDAAGGIVGAHLELSLGGVPVYGAVRYADTYRRGDEGWQIHSRDMRTIFLAPWSTAGDALLSDLPVRWPGGSPGASDYPRQL
jgi:hypothetical protein